jgi:hypothetical protein
MPDEPVPKETIEEPHRAESKRPDPAQNYWPGGPDEVLGTLANGVKVKRRMLRMRACTEKDGKGKMCRGHLKRWFEIPDELRAQFGAKAEVYRCERCKTVYLPNPSETPRTQTIGW